MTQIIKIKSRNKILRLLLLLLFCSVFIFGCTKTEYRTVESPAYIRVFNNLTYTVTINNKEEPLPFFCMFIDPEFDESGKPIGGLVVGDFLDKRNPYASPNPAHMGTGVSKFNPEYPGRETVPTAPILNGFDLTNWAQVTSGKRRFLFMARPISNVPFFQLPDQQQRNVFLDTTITLSEKEVYTIHILQRDFKTKENGLYVRQENFHKKPLSDTLSYVNFYNLSAKGFWSADSHEKGLAPPTTNLLRYGIKDTMNIFLTHMQVSIDPNNGAVYNTPIPEFSYQFAGTMYRDNRNSTVTPYHAFPVLMRRGEKVYTNTWQFLQLVAPQIDPANSSVIPEAGKIHTNPVTSIGSENIYAFAQFDSSRPRHNMHDILPSMIINTHSGVNNPKSFGVVNTVEVINGNIFLTTTQRKFPQPVY